MTDDEIVTALAEALRDIVDDARELGHAEALLPTIRRVAEQWAAEELRAVADDSGGDSTFVAVGPDGRSYRVRPVADLYARAAALTTTPNHGRSAT